MSKIPEGATHWSPGAKDVRWPAFWKEADGGCWCYTIDNRTVSVWVFHEGTEMPLRANPITEHPDYVAPVAEWDGQGLPPVGTVCEVLAGEPWVKWELARIEWRSGTQTLLSFHKSGRAELRDAFSFRKYRTPEQIAAEEHEKLVDEMLKCIVIAPYEMPHYRCFAEALAKAGYRKQEAAQ